MLVLTRKVGQKLVIDGSITVHVVAVEGNRGRLSITAPPGVPVDREEVHLARQKFPDISKKLANAK